MLAVVLMGFPLTALIAVKIQESRHTLFNTHIAYSESWSDTQLWPLKAATIGTTETINLVFSISINISNYQYTSLLSRTYMY